MLILVLERTPLGSLGLVVAVVATSALVSALGWHVATVQDLGVPLGSLPGPMLPDVGLVPELLVPALSLALVGLVQGAGISANFPNEDGSYPDASRDFVGQGVANVASGVFQGMPVGGSVSATSLNKAAGARTRLSLVIAGFLMAIIVVAFGDAVGNVAMPALGGLLMLIGFRTIRPQDLVSVWKTGTAQRFVLAITFALTMLIPLQYAVVCGVALSVALYVIGQSNKVIVRRRLLDESGGAIEGGFGWRVSRGRRTTRISSSTSACLRPRRWASRDARYWRWVRFPPGRFPDYGRRGSGLRHRPGRGDRRGPRARRRDRHSARAGVRRAARNGT